MRAGQVSDASRRRSKPSRADIGLMPLQLEHRSLDIRRKRAKPRVPQNVADLEKDEDIVSMTNVEGVISRSDMLHTCFLRGSVSAAKPIGAQYRIPLRSLAAESVSL